MRIDSGIGEGRVFIDPLFFREINCHPRFLIIANLSSRFHGAIPKILLVDVNGVVAFKWSSAILKTIIQKSLSIGGYKIGGSLVFDIKERSVPRFLDLVGMLFRKPLGEREIKRKSEDFLNGLVEPHFPIHHGLIRFRRHRINGFRFRRKRRGRGCFTAPR